MNCFCKEVSLAQDITFRPHAGSPLPAADARCSLQPWRHIHIDAALRGHARGRASAHCIARKRVRHRRAGREVDRPGCCAHLADAKAFNALEARMQHEMHAHAMRQHHRHGIQPTDHLSTTCRQLPCCSRCSVLAAAMTAHAHRCCPARTCSGARIGTLHCSQASEASASWSGDRSPWMQCSFG